MSLLWRKFLVRDSIVRAAQLDKLSNGSAAEPGAHATAPLLEDLSIWIVNTTMSTELPAVKRLFFWPPLIK